MGLFGIGRMPLALVGLISGMMVSASALAQAPGERQVVLRHALRRELVGCYALFAGDGKRVDLDFYHASPQARLDSVIHPAFVADSGQGARRTLIRLDTSGRRVDPIDRRPRLGPIWWADSISDSISLSFTTGFSGAFLVLAPASTNDTLRGYIENHWDFRDPTGVGTKAYGIRVPCIR